MKKFWDQQIFNRLHDFTQKVKSEKVPSTYRLDIDFVSNKISITNTRINTIEEFTLNNIPASIEQKYFIAQKIEAFIKVNHLNRGIGCNQNYHIKLDGTDRNYRRYKRKIEHKSKELFRMTGYGLNERIITSIRIMPNKREIQYNFTINDRNRIPSDRTISVSFDSKNDLINTLMHTMTRDPRALYYCADKWNDAHSRSFFKHHDLHLSDHAELEKTRLFQKEAFGMPQLREELNYKTVAEIPWISNEARLQEKMTAKIFTNRYHYDQNIVTTDARGRKQIDQEALFRFLSENKTAVALVKGDSTLGRNRQPAIITIALQNTRNGDNQMNALIRTQARHFVSTQQTIQHRHPLLAVSTRTDLAELAKMVMRNNKGEPYIMVIVE